jgi:anthranilate synthase/aminodeoxychorismate synthase-like glutamine amidotransferase
VVLLIDNYDSFTWNLAHRMQEARPGLRVDVVRNDAIDCERAAAMKPTHLVISPGPCTPKEAGVSAELIQYFRGRIPILGVCLGHQTIGDCHGMTVRRADKPMHGKTSQIHHDGRGVFLEMPQPFQATRYHSLVIDPATLSSEFEVSAQTNDGIIMGIRLRIKPGEAPMEGVQFHPESFLTPDGPKLLSNFLAMSAVVR